MLVRTLVGTIAALLLATSASAGSITFNTLFSASQSLWAGGPNAGLDSQNRTSGSVGLYYSVKANTGTVTATQNGGITVNYQNQTVAGAPTTIGLDFNGSPGGVVQALFGAAAEAGVFLDACIGVVAFGSCVGVDFDDDIPLIDQGFFLDPVTTHTPVIDLQRSASDAAQSFGIASVDLGPVGTLGPSMNLDLLQTISFTPTGLQGTARYTNQTTAQTGSTPFFLATDGSLDLQLMLGPGLWDISFIDVRLLNSFRNDIDLGLRPAFDYIIGSWPPVGQPLFSFGLIDQTFSLGFNQIQQLGSIQVEVVETAAEVPEPGSLVLVAIGLGVLRARRQHRSSLAKP